MKNDKQTVDKDSLPSIATMILLSIKMPQEKVKVSIKKREHGITTSNRCDKPI